MTPAVLTPWFPPEVDPVREGNYLSRVTEDSNPTLCTWTGAGWKYSNGATTIYQKREWCGLAFDPDTAAPAHTDTRNYVCFEVPR